MARKASSKKNAGKPAVKRSRTKKLTKKQQAIQYLLRPFLNTRERIRKFQTRRPHRSFRVTQRRDYVRSLQLPGYWAFTNYTRSILWQNRRVFLTVVAVYASFSAIFVGLASQDTYTTLSETLRETSGDIFSGQFGEIGKAGLLFVTGVTGGFTSLPSEAQQVYAGLFGLLTWLTTVWLLRAILSGKAPKFRDGLYSAGSPIIATIIVGFFLLFQLLPGAIGVIIISAIITSSLEGAIAMIFAVAAGLLIALSIYWVTSTLIALVVVTLPGVYPMQAIRAAGDIVIGRRLRILLRWVWLFGILMVIWAVVMIPIIIIDTWMKGLWPVIEWVPVVPVALLLMGSFSVVLTSSYVYLLYRKVVEDDASPA